MLGKSIHLITCCTWTQGGLKMERTWTHMPSLFKHVRITCESLLMYSRIVFDRCPYQEWINNFLSLRHLTKVRNARPRLGDLVADKE